MSSSPPPSPTASTVSTSSTATAGVGGAACPCSVVSVTMNRFMCYFSHTIHLGPHLNLVIGANGTGKSSLVSAICLALGGKVSSLGKTDKISSLIMHGYDSAVVEVELYDADGEGNTRIRRVIHSDNTSTFHAIEVNGGHEQVVSAKRVKSLAIHYGVDVDNLCVLLAQDRVGKFSEMTPAELLIETERALNVEHYERHQRLIEAGGRAKEVNSRLDSLHSFLDKKADELGAYLPQIERLAERAEAVVRLKNLKGKRRWVEYRQELGKQKELKRLWDAAEASFSKLVQNPDDDQKAFDQAAAAWEATDQERKRRVAHVNHCTVARKTGIDKILASMASIKDKEQQIRALEAEEEVFEQELQKLVDNTQEQEEVVMALPPISDGSVDKSKLEAAFKAVALIQSELSRIGREISDLQKIQDQKARKLDDFFRKARHAKYRAQYDLVQRAKQRASSATDGCRDPKNSDYVLQGQVYGPLALEIEYKNDQVGNILETLIDFHRKFIYITDHQDDAVWLGWQDNGSMMVSYRHDHQAAQWPRPDLRHLGVVGYLSEAIVAPKLVMDWLNDAFAITMVPYSSRELDADELDEVFPAAGSVIRVLFTPEHEFKVRYSKYGDKDRSMTDRIIQRAHFFSGSWQNSDDELSQITVLQSAGEASTQELEAATRVRQAQLLVVQKHEALVNNHRIQRDRLARCRLSVQKLAPPDCQEKKTRLKDEILRISTDIVGYAKATVKAETALFETSKQLDVLTLATHQRLIEKEFMLSKTVSRADEEDRLDEARRKAKLDFTQQKKIADDRLALAGPEVEVEGLNENITLDELDDLVQLAQETIDEWSDVDGDGLVERVEACQREVLMLTAELTKRREESEQHSESLTRLRDEWLSPIRDIISDLNTAFAHHMRHMGNAGDVALVEHNDYAQYGVMIRVAFNVPKDEAPTLYPLSHLFQSGGEKSVSTMVYLLCLQCVADSPFRILDEINQGMDPINERKIFNMIVEASSTFVNRSSRSPETIALQQRGSMSPQYVLVSPKLLPKLVMPEEVKMRVIVTLGAVIVDKKRSAESYDRHVLDQVSKRLKTLMIEE